MAANRSRHASMCSITTGHKSPKAPLCIDVIIIGASVAGLACAYSLREAGHNVLVVEGEDVLDTSPGGIRSPPNMSRILFDWGLGPDILKQTSGRCTKMVFHSGLACTGEAMGDLVFHEKVMEALEAEVYLLHHSDLLQMLYKLALGAGAQFNFRSRVVGVDSKSASLTLDSGKKLQADLIVGADGHQGIVRSILQPVRKEREEINYTSYVFTVAVSQFKEDKEIQQLIKEPTWNLWMGSRWGVLGYGVRNNTEFAVSLVKDEESADMGLDWKRRVPIKDLDIEKLDAAPVLKRLMKQAGDVVRIRGDRSTTLENWCDNGGHVVVVGDAAHGWNPGNTHTAALAIEDAVVLGKLLSKVKSKDEIGRFLSAFQELRQPRSEHVCASEQQKLELVTLPPGPLRDGRDESLHSLKAQGQIDWIDSEDSYLRQSWEEFRETFGYDAYDEADTWWVEWGILFERMNHTEETTSGDIFNGQVLVEQTRHVV